MPCFGVQARCRFVQQQHFRPMHDGLTDRHALSQAARQRLAALLQPIGEVEPGSGFAHGGGEFFPGHPVGAGGVGETLPHRQRIVQPKKIRQITDARVRQARFFEHVNVSDGNTAGQGTVRSRDTAQQRGFAGAIRAGKRGNTAARDLERHVVERARAGVDVSDVGDGDGGVGSLHGL